MADRITSNQMAKVRRGMTAICLSFAFQHWFYVVFAMFVLALSSGGAQ